MEANELKRRRNDDGKVEENLLKNNKFGALADNNNDDNAGQAGAGGAPAVPAPSKSAGKQKQPPLVVKNMTYGRLETILVKLKFVPKLKLTRAGIKILPSTGENFSAVQAILKRHKVEFYTHSLPSERPHRVVIRGLPPLDPEHIKSRLKSDYNLTPLEVRAIKRKDESTPVDETPYIVLFPKGHINLKKLREIKYLGPMVIRWEAYRNKQPNVTQCTNCLRLGHGARNCHLKGRCNNCGGSHKMDECQVQEAEPKRCANCSGAHEATDRSCPRRAEFIRARQYAAKPKPPTRKVEKQSPAVPALTLADFPPLPGAVPGEEGKSPRPGGGCKEDTGPRAGGAKQEEGAAGSSQENTGPRAGGSHKAEGEEELYSPAELWSVFVEFSARLRNSKTRTDQVAVLGYMICKYGSK